MTVGLSDVVLMATAIGVLVKGVVVVGVMIRVEVVAVEVTVRVLHDDDDDVVSLPLLSRITHMDGDPAEPHVPFSLNSVDSEFETNHI